ncbi:glycosyltransferase family 8 protein [Acinetobacter sp. ANC 3791]|uniref:glycosyltransferase family 8 protein n=1 Tax=Acinetobacter sp. ANC 3791 TaxID=2529836 RepID=UPI001038A0DF|nr:glycosyltransferase [Acinetobacter sp. ANC 3791]TCB84418.1 glycosyl transferase family 8 [Acinetobacter sp. ANC 3791]
MNKFNDFVSKTYTLSNTQDNFVPNINIAFAIDKNYLKPCGITLYSITKNNPDINIDFHIFTTFFNPKRYQDILEKNNNIRIHVYILNTQFYDNLQVNGHFTTAIYYRLSIASILKDKLDSFWYLDADILCVDSIKGMLSIDINNYVLAAVQDKCMKPDYIESIGLNSNNKYFNSGVLFINVKAWNDFQVFEKFNQLISNRDYKFPDQDVLNILLANKVNFIDEKFNFFTQEKIDPVLIHFVSSPKPWSVAASHSAKYLEYYYQSPWKDQPLDAPRNSKEAKKYAKILWRQSKFLDSIKWYLIYLNKKMIK